MKIQGLTLDLRFKLVVLSAEEGSGIPGVGVKSIDIRKNTEGEGSFLV